MEITKQTQVEDHTLNRLDEGDQVYVELAGGLSFYTTVEEAATIPVGSYVRVTVDPLVAGEVEDG